MRYHDQLTKDRILAEAKTGSGRVAEVALVRSTKMKSAINPKSFAAGAVSLLLIASVVGTVVYYTTRPDNGATQSIELAEEKPFRVPLQRYQCKLQIVESIPVNLTYAPKSPRHMSTYHCWKTLLSSAMKHIDIASFYWALNSSDTGRQEKTASEGLDILDSLMEAGMKRNISIRIVQNKPSKYMPNKDTDILMKAGAAIVQSLDMKRLLGAGIIHTKMWLVDGAHFYVGSANFDWRSLTQVKEMGVMVYNCTKLAQDMQKIFEVYWKMSQVNTSLPAKWPRSLETSFNSEHPMNVDFNGTYNSSVYLSSSPPEFCPRGRTTDIGSILDIIDSAKKFVYIAVMDYSPMMLYTWPKTFWPVIDDKLREVAVLKGVEVKMLISLWNHTKPLSLMFLKSLAILSSKYTSIEVKLFKVPCVTPEQCEIPFARVNHNKYMVTDDTAYVGTSNWSGDYFVNTAGIGFVLKSAKNGTNSKIRQDLEDVFLRDWNSGHSKYLPLNGF